MGEGSRLLFVAIPDYSVNLEGATAPVFLPGQFLGRAGLVRNMLWRVRRGESLSLFGGPKLGKTSLLLHLAWQLHEGTLASSDGASVAEYFDLALEADYVRLQARSPNPDEIVLLDNCDSVMNNGSRSFTDITSVHARAIVFAGGRAWNDYQQEEGVGSSVKAIPLAVMLEHEARQIVAQHLSTAHHAWALTNAGTHPFLLRLLLAEYVRAGKECELDLVVHTVKDSIAPFFDRCVAQLRDPLEHQVLDYVVRLGKPVNPKDVGRVVGCSTMKSIVNTLCVVGVISRWIRDEEATLCANSQLFREWYLETRASS